MSKPVEDLVNTLAGKSVPIPSPHFTVTVNSVSWSQRVTGER
jgi:hypothetical protein